MLSLARGQKTRLDAVTPAHSFTVGVGASGPGLSFDISCFGVDEANQLSDDRYFIFYNQPSSPEGALKLAGARGEDAESFAVDLSRLPQSIRKLVFTITIDGAGEMRQLSKGHLRLVSNGAEAARFEFSGANFSSEKAIIAAEVYFKDAWRLAAVGQGFAGGLSALLKHFGGQEAEEAAPSPTLAPTPAAPSAPPQNVPHGRGDGSKVELEKKMERQAPQLLSLAKQAQVSLEKAGLPDHAARVALCLDISASMGSLYHSGKIQRLAEKVLALGTRFDDDGSIDIFLFGAGAHDVGPMTVDNFSNFIGQILRSYPLEGGTMYGRAMQLIRRHYFPGSGGPVSSPQSAHLPVYVMFLTDGQTGDPAQTRQQLEWAAYEPIFWQFMGIGKSKKDVAAGGGGFWARAFASDFSFLEEMDTMGGRYIDNASFFSLSDPEIIPDPQLYDLLMAEYPSWVRTAPSMGLLR